MHKTVEEFLARLEQATGRAPRPTWDGWQANCPAHEDRQASLSVCRGEAGHILLKCHAGCPSDDVVAAIGWKLSDVTPEQRSLTYHNLPSRHEEERGRQGDKEMGSSAKPPCEEVNGATSPQLEGDLREAGKTASGRTRYPTHAHAWAALTRHWGEPAASWEYHDRAGKLVGMVLRWDTPSGKEIRPLARVAGGWRIGAMPAPRPIFRLELVVASAAVNAPVFVVEGEKAAAAGAQLKLATTTSAGGSAAAHQTDWSPLAGRDVVILPDNDDPGRKYAHEVVGQLVALSPRPTIRVVRLPDLPSGGDLADYIAQRGDLTHAKIAQELTALCAEQTPVTSAAQLAADAPAAARQASQSRSTEADAISPIVTRLDECAATTVEWLWPGRIPFGKFTMLVGDPGLGKSFLTLDLAARITRGAALPPFNDVAKNKLWEASPTPISRSLATPADGQHGIGVGDPSHTCGARCAPGSVILLSAEDDVSDTIRPRLAAAGADLSRVVALQAVGFRDAKEGKLREAAFSLATDLGVLEQLITTLGDCRLVVIDPITAYLGSADSHNNAEMRSLLAPLSALAARTGVALLAINHLNKANQGPAIYRSMGSVAFAATARSALAVLADPNDPSARVLVSLKNNLAASHDGARYRIAPREGDKLPVIHWDHAPVRMAADEIMNAATQSAAAGGATLEAADWLTEMLRSGPQPAAELKTLAKADGIHERTLLRAKSRLGLVCRRQGIGLAGSWVWQLPEGPQASTAAVA